MEAAALPENTVSPKGVSSSQVATKLFFGNYCLLREMFFIHCHFPSVTWMLGNPWGQMIYPIAWRVSVTLTRSRNPPTLTQMENIREEGVKIFWQLCGFQRNKHGFCTQCRSWSWVITTYSVFSLLKHCFVWCLILPEALQYHLFGDGLINLILQVCSFLFQTTGQIEWIHHSILFSEWQS